MKGFKMPGSEHLAGFRTVRTIMVLIFLLTAVTMLELPVSADLAEETSALLSLKAAWGNPAILRSWTTNSTTNNGTSIVCSSWAHVTCDSNGTAVTELRLHNSGLSGTLVSQLGHLSSLVVLDLGSNTFSGIIPNTFVNLTQLTYLDFSANNFGGNIPISIGNSTSLQYLDLSFNYLLTGIIPESLTNLSQLYHLDLSANNFTGEIPISIESLNSLQYLSLSSNGFYGTIPKTMGDLTQLSHLLLSGCQFSGEIPTTLGKLTNLSFIDFTNNNFNGSILDTISNLTALTYLVFSGCEFSGTMPTTFGKLSKLSQIDFTDNRFYGSIPESIGNITSLSSLEFLDCQFSGVIPTTLGQLTQLSYIDFKNNNFNGSISESFGNLTSLTIIDFYGCEFSGVMPTTLGQLTQLSYLGFSNNNFNGSIPESFGNLTSLTAVFLDGCLFSGEISTSFSKLTSLISLFLSGNNFLGIFLEKIDNLTVLTDLHLGDNHFSGSIPESIGGLTSFFDLDLSDNDFNGSIPLSIVNLTYLNFLNLYNNYLSGSIPPELGLLTGLQILDLHDNNLTGSIPESLKDLTNLITLNLAGNFLNGSVSTSILSLPHLQTISIEDNCLDGTMPILSSITGLVFTDSNNCFDNETCNSKCVPKQESTNQGKSAKNLIIILFGVIGGLLFVGAILLIFICKKGQKHQNDILNLPVHLKQYTLLEVMEATDNLNTKVGEGGFSSVYKATFKDGSLAAVKHFNKTQKQENFEFEIEVLAHLNHRYLVNLIGFCSEKDELMLMFDFMDGGNLFQRLHGKSLHDPLTWSERMKIVMNVTRGIEYLHFGCTPPLIHRDIKSSNILLSKSIDTAPINAKLADFGLGKHTIIDVSYYEIMPTRNSLESSPCPTRVAGTPGYVDPEYMTTFQVSSKCDVYSYGVVLLEILTGRQALFLKELLVNWVKLQLDEKDVWSIVDSKLDKKNIPEQQLMGVVELALQCIRKTSDTRPSIREVLKSLIELLYSESSVNDFSSSFKSDARMVELFPPRANISQSLNWSKASFQIDNTIFPASI